MNVFSDAFQMQQNSPQGEESYTHAWQHYRDELQRLDLMIYYLLQSSSSQEANAVEDPLQRFQGLVITREETERLLLHSPFNAEQQKNLEEMRSQYSQWGAVIESRKEGSRQKGVFLPLVYLAEKFQLSAFEVNCLLICLALEIDRKYEKLFAYLQDDVQQKYPTVDLALKLFTVSFEERVAVQDYFSPQGKLFTYFLNQPHSESNQPLLSRRLILDERIFRFLLHVHAEDEQLVQFTEYVRTTDEITPLFFDSHIQDRIQAYLSSLISAGQGEEMKTVLFFKGMKGSGKKLHVKHICRHFNQNVLIINLDRLFFQTDKVEDTLNRVFREAILQQAVLCFTHFETLLADDCEERYLYLLTDLIRRFDGVVFLLSEKEWKPLHLLEQHTFIRIDLSIPPEKESERFWEKLGQGLVVPEMNWGNIASKFRFTPGQMVSTIQTIKSRAGWSKDEEERVTESTIVTSAYEQVQHKLEKKAVRLTPKYTWDDLVLPEDQKDQMRMACNQIKYRHVVFDQWGFHRRLTYGKGASMLFSGPPGTGKTMSAEVIAKELLLEIYKIDLSQVISKYIGETEKNLQEIFSEAHYSNAILFFDETDALFGKRSEVKDSKDKYANIEVAYLLQKMEEYQGITVLATNLLQNIDEAFMRRINYVIKFPFPDAEYREQIWRSMFPDEAPLSDDIDFQYIAEKLQVAGGNIKNIALSAAFLAADARQEIQMKHIIKAAKHEMQKMGKILIQEDFEDFWE